MIVKVVPLPCEQGLKFDIILPDMYVVTIRMEEYELRAHRASIADVIEIKVLEWLAQNDYEDDEVVIVYC